MGGKKKGANSQENVNDILLGRISSGFSPYFSVISKFTLVTSLTKSITFITRKLTKGSKPASQIASLISFFSKVIIPKK